MQSKTKKIIYIFNMSLTAITVVMAILILISAITARQAQRVPKLFGHTFHIVVSPSMEPDIKVGDFVVAKVSDISSVENGDYVVFASPDPNLMGITIIHKVIDINIVGEKKLLTTSGIKQGTVVDKYPVSEIIGIYSWKSTFIGKTILFFTSTKNLLFIGIILICFVFIAKYSVQIFNIIKNQNKNNDKNHD